MSGYVCVDANVAAKWVIPEDETHLALSLYHKALRDEIAVVAPPHLRIEVASTLRKKVFQGHDDHQSAVRRLIEFEILKVEYLEPPGLYRDALAIADLYKRPTAYDAHYIALAAYLDCEFWTANYRLINALEGRLRYVRPLHEFKP